MNTIGLLAAQPAPAGCCLHGAGLSLQQARRLLDEYEELYDDMKIFR